MKIIKQIFKEIKNANTIVIGRHIGPDPDCIGAQNALKELIKLMFPTKNVFVLGANTKKLSYLGVMDRINEEDIEHDLLIIVDTPNISRIDSINVDLYKQVIKIDHHLFIEDFNGIEWVDITATSACEMIIQFIFKLKLPINDIIATNLYVGVMSDTNRFLHLNHNYRSIELISKLLEKNPLPLQDIHHQMYERNINEWRFQGYLISNIESTKHGVGYIHITDNVLKEFKVDVGSAGNLINSFLNIKELPVIVFFTEDVRNKNTRVSIRSSIVNIHRVAEAFGGGGHPLAAGTRLNDEKDINKIIEALDKLLKDTKE